MWNCWRLCSLGALLWGQSFVQEPLTHGIAVGPLLHSYGWGISLLVPKWHTPRRGTLWLGELTSYRLRSEARTRSAYRDQGGKDYVFGKLYYAYLLEIIWGYQYILMPRTAITHAQLSLFGGIGPAFTLLKPYYIEIAIPISANQAVIQVDTYDPTRHSYYDIVGEADFYLGFDQLRAVPGAVIQAGILLDIGKNPSLIRALALGGRWQFFSSPIKTLHQYPGRRDWLSGFMAFYIGNGWK
ncbi:MAG: hypothetical protein NZ580_02270 [Bacteroidia bacterium]|nr:hypothetical protein [Bacteroidia bacterium]MDW8235796.1 hypothetical protein [Bacteroidia bacterium]